MQTNKVATYATSFQEIYLSNSDYKDLFQKDSSDKDAFCKIFRKTLSISAMGEKAIKFHAKFWIHLSRRQNSSRIASFYSKSKRKC